MRKVVIDHSNNMLEQLKWMTKQYPDFFLMNTNDITE
jgi:hypothetical protein